MKFVGLKGSGQALPQEHAAKEPTKDEIVARLAELGVEAGKGLTKAELLAMLEDAEAGE